MTSTHWRSYPILRFSDVPIVQAVLLDEKEVEREGLGGIATDPALGAAGNAMFNATGVRLPRGRFTAARRKAARA